MEMDNSLSNNNDIYPKNIIDNPWVTIITPVLNGSKYLELSIQSILMQSYPNTEHVFADGGSTDGTVEILSKYHSRYPDRIRFISEPDNGTGEAMNKCLRMAKGEIFAFLGSDDLSEPDAIQNVIEFFRSNPDAYFVFGACNRINEKGDIIRRRSTREFNYNEILNYGDYVPWPSAFFRRKVVETVGYFDAPGNDLEYLLRVAKVFKIYRIEKVLSNFRVHEGSATSGSRIKIRKYWARECFKVSRKYGGRFFSAYCISYYMIVISEPFQPIIDAVYPTFYPVLKRITTVIDNCPNSKLFDILSKYRSK